MTPALALLPSALLGPAIWRPVARILAARGWDLLEVPALTRAPGTPGEALGWYLAAIPVDREVVVVPHSNAGLYVPALTAQRWVEAMVYVDAAVPPHSGPYPLAPSEFSSFLEGLADPDGRLPVWTQWWGDDLADHFPSAAVRAQVESEQQRLPLAYFAGSLVAPAGWDDRPAGYLAFGATYDEDRAGSLAGGWSVITMPGAHLHMLVEPTGVADAIEDLLRRIL